MGGRGEHVYVLRFYVYGKVPYGLHRVGVERDALRSAYGAYLSYGLYGSDLVVGVHYRYQAGVRAYGGFQLLRADQTVLVHRKKRNFEAFRLQFLKRVENRVVFESRGYYVGLSGLLSRQGGGS